jgi:hypothetical protein
VVDAQTAAYVRSMLPRNVGKYWLQRYSLFSRFDEGVQVGSCPSAERAASACWMPASTLLSCSWTLRAGGL